MAEKIRSMERSKIDFSELTVEEDTLTSVNSETIQQYHTSHSSIQPDEILSNTIGPFLADLDTGTKTTVALSSTYSTTFQEPAIPLPQNNIIQSANIPIFSQLNDPPTPVRPPGLDGFEIKLSSNYESNNEMSSNI
ncbi:hypothetical protein BpHYR1_019649 [Brachionus plicatilis]|uniref:Uncharacterized protein n=1 Tax=Brachionus plicatilis TaxID=10195 RepID=A0A3M7Q736_BRAPC|nr:hypothetical protein BpHYR1_019649 [Brachionus plicatilis]